MSDNSGKDTEFVSQDEIDRLLGQVDELSDETDDHAAPEENEAETAADVSDGNASADDGMPTENSTDDLDKLSEEAPEEDDPGDSDDFDGLLEEAIEDDQPEGSDDLDGLLEEATGQEDEAADEAPVDRVILEEVPEEPRQKTPRTSSIWPVSRDFWIILSAVLFLGITVNGSLWMYNNRSLKVIAPEILWFPVVHMSIDTEPTTYRISPRAITLKGFLVPAPVERKDLTYITADVSIELTHTKAVSLIKAHAPFYRNIIYDVIKKVLGALDKSKISEISLKIEILKALNGSVPERSVRDVIVDTFVMF